LTQTLQTEIQNMKDQVQELHRDLTKHHSLINTDTMGEILDRSLHIDGQISSQYSSVETMRALFEEVHPQAPYRTAAICLGGQAAYRSFNISYVLCI
jgi:hypothetical protein